MNIRAYKDKQEAQANATDNLREIVKHLTNKDDTIFLGNMSAKEIVLINQAYMLLEAANYDFPERKITWKILKNGLDRKMVMMGSAEGKAREQMVELGKSIGEGHMRTIKESEKEAK